MAKLSDATRLARLLAILRHLERVDRATVGDLAGRFGGSPRSVYEDLVAAWTAEDPQHTGIFPLSVEIEYFETGEPGRKPIRDREVWLSPGPGDGTKGLSRLLAASPAETGDPRAPNR